MLSKQSDTAEAGTIGGRYLVEAELGRGGMARVYRVVDERTGDRLALKKLIAGGDKSATLQAMFEREYHTLVQLAHPRIIRVCDYGVDGGSPYYTMELLDGADVRETFRDTPPTVQQSCVLLRDVASALALIHSRRMVHRDVSPRNVWRTPDGRAKLIDFGTLVAMGPQTRAAGTPPYVPPEAVYVQPLDARSDIYALGALGYYLLTGRHAYPAREIAQLRQVWQRGPKRPDALSSGVPRALADLVMAMLSLDPRGRPGSAAEVFDRLSAIADLPAEDERRTAQAFLTSPTLVGREPASSAIRKRLLRAIRGRGSAIAIVAPAGLGRSRMLASAVLEAKLLGAAAASVDAAAVVSGPFAVATAIAELLLDALPMTAAAAVDAGPVLGHLSPALHRAFGEPQLAPLTPLERGLKLTSALVTLFEASARSQRVVIAVDDVHRADGPSLGVLGRLSLLAPEHQLLVVTTCEAGALAHAPPALEQLCRPGQRIELAPLGCDDTRALLESLFGASPGLTEAASWLHDVSQGSPQACMQYAQYLVDAGIARYEGGQFKLPRHLREQALPPTLEAMIEGRLRGLSDDARALGLALALARDETRSAWQPEMHVRIEDYPRLIEGGDAGRAFLALDELLQAGLIQQRDSFYVLGQSAIVDALLRTSPEPARQRAHARLAEVLRHGGYRAGLLVLLHLQRAGEHTRARALLVEGSARARPDSAAAYDWGAMRLSIGSEVGRAALADYETHGGSPREGILLRRTLMLMCSVYDWSNARMGDAQLAQLRADSGLVYWDETDPAQPPLARMMQCVQRAQQAHDAKPEHERGFAPLEAIGELLGVTLALSGAYTHSHEIDRVRQLPAIVEPLRAQSPIAQLFVGICNNAVARATGRELGDAQLDAANGLGQAQMLPEVVRVGGSVIHFHLHVVEDARRGRQRALELADLLASVVGEDMFFVQHARWLAHAFRGHARLAEGFRKRVEVITEDDVWRRKAVLFVEAQLHALTGDLPALQRTAEAIAELSAAFPGWRPWLSYSRAEVHRLHGNLEASATELQAALELARAGEHRAWVLAAPAHAALRLARGDARGALSEAQTILELVRALGLDRSAEVEAERTQALSQAVLGDHEGARTTVERAFRIAHELGYEGLPLARLYEAQARIALAARERDACRRALQLLWKMLEHADAPSLIHAYEALREESSQELALADLPAASAPGTDPSAESTEFFTQIRTRLSALDDRQQRARHALELLLSDSGARAGHLFLFDAGGAFAAASLGCAIAKEALLAEVEQYLQAELNETKTAVLTVADKTAAQSSAAYTLSDGDTRLVPVLLCDGADGESSVIGLALLAVEGALRPPRGELVRAIGRCLLAAGDSIAQSGDV